MKDEALVQLVDVSLSYAKQARRAHKARKAVLERVNCSVRRGEVLGITGRNGAGKSTLLRLIARTLQPSSGVVINRAAHTALLTLGLAVEARLSGYLNAIIFGLYLGYSLKHIRLRLPEILEFSELGDEVHEPVYTYSTGMKARLSFSVALFLNTELLLIDETLSVGDPEFRRKSGAALKRKLQGDTTAIIVSNSPDSLDKLCDRRFKIRNGHLEVDSASLTRLQGGKRKYKNDRFRTT